jgi:HEAT repeat protein
VNAPTAEHLESLARQLAHAQGGDLDQTMRFVQAVARISPDLLPSPNHPLAHHIAAGPAAFDELGRMLADAGDDELAPIVDAISSIVEQHVATDQIREALRQVARTASPDVAAMAVKALAISGDRDLLEYEHHMLWSESVSRVQMAIRILGYGRHQPAVPALIALFHPFRASIALDLLWALGEIGDEKALTAIHVFLEAGLLAAEAAEAAGKIGSGTSVPLLLPILEHGGSRERQEAARALGLIGMRPLDGNVRDAAKSALSRALDRDTDRAVRYHAIIGLSRAGERVEPRRINRALDVQMPAEQMDPRAAFFAKRN